MAKEPVNAEERPKRNLAEFARETKREIAKVTWPARKEISVTTALIVVFAIITGVFFLVVDSALGFVVSKVLGMHS